MNSELLAEVEQTAGKFAARHLAPIAAQVDHDDPAFPIKVFAQGIEAGFDRFVLPEQAGGYGFGMTELCGLIRTLASTCAAHAMVFGIHSAAIKTLHDCGGDLAAPWLEEIFSAGKPMAAVIPDPAGQDGFETELTATRQDSSDEMLNGKAGLAVNGAPDGFYLLFAQDPSGTLKALLAKGGTSGLQVGAAEPTLGLRAVPMVECACNDVSVPATHLLASGKEAVDFYRAFLRNLCLVVSAAACGLMTGAVKKATAYAAERYQGGRMIIDHSHMRNILGAMQARAASAQGAVWYEAARPGDLPAALAVKATVTDQAMAVCTDAVQVLGGYGYMRDYGMEKAMRDAAVLALLPISNIRAELLIAAIAKSNL